MLAVVCIASFGVVQVASAHSFQAEITCTHASFFFGAFDQGVTNTIHEVVAIDNVTVATQDFTFVGVQGSNTIPISVPAGTHTVTATGSWTVAGGGNQTATQIVNCSQGSTPGTPSLTTNASGPATVGGAIHDVAHLSGGTAPLTGTITFDVYDSTCTTKLTTVAATAAVNGAGDYTSADYTPAAAASYNWVAHYSGDANNNKVDTACGAPNETSTVNRTTPSIATTLSATSVNTGTAVHDSAKLTGATANAGGTVTYTVYTNNACNAGAVSAGTKTVTNGVVPNSNDVTLNAAGDYYWQAAYSGDTNNGPATSVCTSEHLVVTTPGGGGGGGGETQTTPVTTQTTPTTTTPAASTPLTTTPTITTKTTTPTTTTPSKPKAATTPKPKAKPKPKPFTPPHVKKKVKSSPPPCYVVAVAPKNLTVGKPATLRMRVTGSNKPIPGTTVSIKGAGIQVLSGRTNGSGNVIATVHPRKPGLISFRSASHKSCSTARVGVVSAFTPPVTG